MISLVNMDKLKKLTLPFIVETMKIIDDDLFLSHGDLYSLVQPLIIYAFIL